MPNQSDIDLANVERQYAAAELANISLDTETPVVPRRILTAAQHPRNVEVWSAALASWDDELEEARDSDLTATANLYTYGYSDYPYTMRMFGETPIFETQRWENVYQIEDNMYTVQETMEVAGLQMVKLLNINTNEVRVGLLFCVPSQPIGRIRL